MKQGAEEEEELESLHHENTTMESTLEHDPLLTTEEDSAEDDIHLFAEQQGLTNKLQVLQRAAILIRGDTPVVGIRGIRIDELRALGNESRRKWRQPVQLYLAITVTALGAVGQGWAQTAMNGANLYYREYPPNHVRRSECTGTSFLTFAAELFGIGSDSARDNLIVGLINCGIYLSNGLLGCWLVSPINNRLGRRGAVFVAAVVSFVATLLGGSTRNWQQLLCMRLLLGVGLGVIASTLNVYAAECAPAAIRGGLAVSWQMFCAFGIFVGFAVNGYVDGATEQFGPTRWRIMLTAPVLGTVPLLLLIYLCPESPSWHMKHSGRYDLAFASLCRLRNTELQAARELYISYLQQKRSSKSSPPKPSSYLRSLTELLTIPRNRRAAIAAWTTMLSQQLCGINIIAFYSSTIFADAHFSPSAASLASTIFGLVNFLGAFPAIWTMDTLGRRSLLLLTLPLMAISMAVAGFSFSIDKESHGTLRFSMITTMIYLFCLLYSPGMGPVPPAYAAEVFPLSHREIGTGSAIAMANIFATVLSLTFPYLLSVMGNQGAFLLYAALNVLAWVLVFFLVPETKMRTLEELDGVFSISTRRFIRYQTKEYLPWWTKRYLLGNQKLDLVRLEAEDAGRYSAVGQEEAES